MKHVYFLWVMSLFFFITACSTETPTPTPTPSKTQVKLEVKNNATFGDHATNEAGESLYLFLNDTKDANTSACNDACAATWPAFTLDPSKAELVAGAGADGTKLGSFKRGDGTTQVTYNGWPLYRFSKDATPGDTNGQGVGSVWFLVSAEGKKIETPQPPAKPTFTLELATSAEFGPHLVDEAGHSLYLFTNDTKDSNSSVCNDACAQTWPALTFDPAAFDLAVGDGLEASKLGSFQRTDGKTQITYNGWPLYMFSNDTAIGDTKGQGIGSVWFLVSAEGKKIESASTVD
jgi:predicted lipoprotein with Yx(FWY)xxD motif